jgi:hypothetical protein
MTQIKPDSIWRTATERIGRRLPISCLVIGIAITMLLISNVSAITMHPNYANQQGGPLYKSAVAPNQTLRVHRVSNVYFSITNYGKLGSENRDITDPLTNLPAPSCEFPAGSNLEYLFQGCIWIGAVSPDPENPGELDTLVSIGDDGWWRDITELNPESPPYGNILELSIRGENSPPYAPTSGVTNDLPNRTFDAISEQDFICVFTDTVIVGVSPDPNDNRAHRPLGIRIIQKSYSWSYEYAEDFILLDFEIENIGILALDKVWLGLYIDADVMHSSEDGYGIEEGAQDDICGFLQKYYPDPTDTTVYTDIYTAWIADNDGQPTRPADNPGPFLNTSARGVSGCRVVQSPGEDIQYGFNWWISNSVSQLDWGPVKEENERVFPGGGRGTPGGDGAKYYVMANGEFDYDQIWSALDHDDEGWLPIPSGTDADDLADGYDTRYLYSFGEFNQLYPHTVLPLTVAYVCGDGLHKNPLNWRQNLRGGTGDSASVARYYNNLDFRDFATNAQWAEWVFDNPGRDSCWDTSLNPPMWVIDEIRGSADTTGWKYDSQGDSTPVLFWYEGDGCPDFKGPPPPYSPKLDVNAEKGGVKIVWRGTNADEPNTGPEDGYDSFNGQQDFEGYAIYFSYDELEWTLVRRYDKIDWVPKTWDATVDPPQWVTNKDKIYPISTDSVIALGGDPFTHSDDISDTNWVAFDLNTSFEGILDSSIVEDGDTVNYYSFSMDGLSTSRGTYFCVTAFDFGDPLTSLSSLESAKSINSNLVYPISKEDPIFVYPNPYKITNTQDYIDMGYEDPSHEGWDEQDRRIWFSNLPDDQRAIIRIWTLDGDLVRAITYDPTEFIGNPSGIIHWDLVTRNGQAIVSGMYLYSIEFVSISSSVADRESEIGKFVIIK